MTDFFYSIQADGMLAEGSPIAPEPMVVSWRPDYVVGAFLYIVPRNLYFYHFSHFLFYFFSGIKKVLGLKQPLGTGNYYYLLIKF
jgi:hypothetical protein